MRNTPRLAHPLTYPWAHRLGHRLAGTKVGERARAALGVQPAARAEPPQPEGPTAVYARILDGDSLWLAVTGTDEAVGLRHEPTGKVVEPANDAPADPAAASYRWHLPSALPALADGVEHDVFVLVTLASGAEVRTPALPDAGPMSTPPTRDGRWQLEVRRRDSGVVVVRRERRAPVAEVVDLDPTDDGLTVRFTDPGLEHPRLLLAAADGVPRHASPVAREGDLLAATLAADAVPDEEETEWLVSVGDGTRSVPLVRPRNDCARPGFATVLPILWSDDGDGRRTVRLRYLPDGRLRAHRPAAGEAEPS